MRSQLIGATLLGATAAAAALGLSASAAKADLIINPNGNAGGIQATLEPALNGGPGFPLNLFGYIGPAQLVAETTADYRFTFEGAGNTTNATTFTSTTTAPNSGGGTFTANPPGGTGAGSSSSGATFLEHLIAGTPINISFTFTSSSGPCSVSNGGGAVPPGGSVPCEYLIALANATTSPGATSPSQTTAWIGLSDAPYPADHDFQDLVVRVDEIATPEPASVALLGTALIGMAFGFCRRNRKLNGIR